MPCKEHILTSESLTGSRVRLVAPVEADEARFLEATNNSRSLHHPWVYPPLDPEGFSRLLARSRQDDERVFLLKTIPGDQLCGVVSLNVIIYDALCGAFLSYYSLSGFDQRGLMKEGLQILISHAFSELELHRLEANIQPGNAPSAELARSLGFRPEGFSPQYLKIAGKWRDHERWALINSDYPASG
jgi:ribosomal-protein-alanine N-acetyltransferase